MIEWLLGIFGSLTIAVLIAMCRVTWKLSVTQAATNVELKHLSEVIGSFTGYGDRISVNETRLDGHDGRLDGQDARLDTIEQRE
jgi:hypothetical protein